MLPDKIATRGGARGTSSYAATCTAEALLALPIRVLLPSGNVLLFVPGRLAYVRSLWYLPGDGFPFRMPMVRVLALLFSERMLAVEKTKLRSP